MNAIYGSSTVSIASANEYRTAVSLHLEPYNFSFLVSFPDTYPAEPPAIAGIDMLILGTTEKGKRALAGLRSSLELVYKRDSVCLFDLVEHFNDTFRPAEENRPAAGAKVSPSPRHQLEEQVRIKMIDFASYQKTVTCTACLDVGLAIDLGRLRCGHFFCSDCLQRENIPTFHFQLL